MKRRLLILGGTGEAAALAEQAGKKFGDSLDVVSSLAGRVNKPRPLPGTIRLGGFGGADGLADYLMAEKIDFLIDATHPFATRISANAHLACDRTKTPRLILERPPWPDPDGVVRVDDFAAAAQAVRKLGKRAFLSFGHQGLEAFADLGDVKLVIRVIEPPSSLPNATLITERPPFTRAHEKKLLSDHQIDVLVSKDSGGAALPAKITAAQEMALAIILIARPAPEPGDTVTTVEDALMWLGARP